VINHLKNAIKNFNFWVTLSFLISLVFVIQYKFLDDTVGHNQKYNTIVSDGKGYYAYLPAIFIYNDLNFGFNQTVEKHNHPETWYTDYRYKLDKKRIFTKYYVGTAIAYSPFFLIAHGWSLMMGWQADGYTAIYHGSVLVAALFYMVITLIFMGKILDFYRINHWIKVLSILGAYFGTNWFYYTTWEASLSHVYSAGVIAAFFYYAIIFSKDITLKWGLIIGVLLGLIVLLRPLNILVVLFLPLFHYKLFSFIRWVKSLIAKPVILGLSFISFLAVLSIQFIIYKIQIDQWYIYAYLNEGFNFLKPHFFNFLFSIRKGFFVYTPLFLLSILGLVSWAKFNSFQVLWWILSVIILVYILSSWHMWWYGGTFGTRVLIEYYIIWIIPLAILFQKAGRYSKFFLVMITCFFVFNGVLQQYQYRKGIIHYDNMNWQMYKEAFLHPIIP
tara:strand:- start:5454 stop:6785 length:1332 start_codon:yes stop_codon:yes gene_type:complete